jgi:hypothetical protein
MLTLISEVWCHEIRFVQSKEHTRRCSSNGCDNRCAVIVLESVGTGKALRQALSVSLDTGEYRFVQSSHPNAAYVISNSLEERDSKVTRNIKMQPLICHSE